MILFSRLAIILSCTLCREIPRVRPVAQPLVVVTSPPRPALAKKKTKTRMKMRGTCCVKAKTRRPRNPSRTWRHRLDGSVYYAHHSPALIFMEGGKDTLLSAGNILSNSTDDLFLSIQIVSNDQFLIDGEDQICKHFSNIINAHSSGRVTGWQALAWLHRILTSGTF